MRRLVLCVSGCLALTVAACSGDTEAAGGTTQAPTGSPASVQADEAEEAPAELVPVVDRLDTGDDLLAGPGDEQLTLNAVASDGEVVIAAGELAQEDRNEREPVLFRSSDGREWERVDLSDSVPGDGYLAAVVTTSAGFLAVGNGDEGEPVALRSADGDAWEAAAVDFGDDADEGRVQVAAAAAAGDRVMVLGFALEGMSVEEGSSYTVELSTSISEDGGTSWQQGQVPDVEQAEVNSATRQQVQAGHRTSQHRGWPKCQVEDVAGDVDPRGLCGHPAEQRPGVEEPGLVRMVLEGDQIQAGLLAEPGQRDHRFRRLVLRRDERPEAQLVPVVRHLTPIQLG